MVLTERNIPHAFRGAGICPIDVDKRLSKVVTTKRPPSPNPLPTTPKKARLNTDNRLRSPENAADVQKRLERVRKETGNVPRAVRTLVNQNSKQTSRLNTMIATQAYEINFLKEKLKAQKPTSKEAVDYDPNERFARIREIAYTQYEAERAPERIRDRDAPKL